MILTWPGIAKPIENIANSTFPVIVIDRAIANATMLAKKIVISTENTATNKIDTDTTKDKKTVEVPVKYIPWWVKCLAYWGAACLLYVAWKIYDILYYKK